MKFTKSNVLRSALIFNLLWAMPLFGQFDNSDDTMVVSSDRIELSGPSGGIVSEIYYKAEKRNPDKVQVEYKGCFGGAATDIGQCNPVVAGYSVEVFAGQSCKTDSQKKFFKCVLESLVGSEDPIKQYSKTQALIKGAQVEWEPEFENNILDSIKNEFPDGTSSLTLDSHGDINVQCSLTNCTMQLNTSRFDHVLGWGWQVYKTR